MRCSTSHCLVGARPGGLLGLCEGVVQSERAADRRGSQAGRDSCCLISPLLLCNSVTYCIVTLCAHHCYTSFGAQFGIYLGKNGSKLHFSDMYLVRAFMADRLADRCAEETYTLTLLLPLQSIVCLGMAVI